MTDLHKRNYYGMLLDARGKHTLFAFKSAMLRDGWVDGLPNKRRSVTAAQVKAWGNKYQIHKTW